MSALDRLQELAESGTPGPWTKPELDTHPGDEGWWFLNGEVGAKQHAVGLTVTYQPNAQNDAVLIVTLANARYAILKLVEHAAEIDEWWARFLMNFGPHEIPSAMNDITPSLDALGASLTELERAFEEKP